MDRALETTKGTPVKLMNAKPNSDMGAPARRLLNPACYPLSGRSEDQSDAPSLAFSKHAARNRVPHRWLMRADDWSGEAGFLQVGDNHVGGATVAHHVDHTTRSF